MGKFKYNIDDEVYFFQVHKKVHLSHFHTSFKKGFIFARTEYKDRDNTYLVKAQDFDPARNESFFGSEYEHEANETFIFRSVDDMHKAFKKVIKSLRANT